MHPGAYRAMKRFVKAYMQRDRMYRILDVGSQDLLEPGTAYEFAYRNLFKGWFYEGLDVVEGKNVDIVSKDPYHYPIEDNMYDVVISSQVMEHVPDLHAFIKECARVLKPGGLMCMVVPYKWRLHAVPVDCWRVFPDGMSFLMRDVAGLEVLEVYRARTDTIGVARKHNGSFQ